MAEQALNRLSRASGALAVGAFTVSQCLYNVDGGERAVMFDTLRGGIRDDVRNEGTHFLIPIIQRPIVIDVRTKPREIPSVTGTKDLQSALLYSNKRAMRVILYYIQKTHQLTLVLSLSLTRTHNSGQHQNARPVASHH